MDPILWITLLMALLVSLIALVYVVTPLLTKQPPLMPVDDDRLADLLARKDSTLRAIKELEFDHQVGKIGADDYHRFNQRLRRQAIVLIQQVEKITPESTALDEQLEAAIASRRQAQPAKAVTTVATQPSPADGATVVAAQPTMAQGASTRFCTECGARLDPAYKFCANCGAPVAPVAAATS